jgi:biotin operon repressor
MGEKSEEADQHAGSLDTRTWQARDSAAMEVRTEHDPQFFTTHLYGLRVLGLALSDPKRLLILSLLAEENRAFYGQEIAERLGVTPQTISHHLQILKNGGLVREERRGNAYRYYTLDTASIHYLRERFFSDDHLGLLSREEAQQKVLATFFEGERLLSLPTQQSKRRIILLELARRFEWGRIYSEGEVNALLKAAFDDVASLRRSLIDEQIMAREQGRYWLTHPRAEQLEETPHDYSS